MSLFGSALQFLGNAAAVPIDSIFGPNAAPWQWGQGQGGIAGPQQYPGAQGGITAADPMAGITVSGADPTGTVMTPMAASDGGGAQPMMPQVGARPNPPGHVPPLLGMLDGLLFNGGIERTAAGNYARDMARYQTQQLINYGNSLPPSEQAAFMADPAGYIKNQEEIRKANQTPVTAKAGESVVFGGPGGTVFNAPTTGIDASSGLPYSQTPNSFTVQGPSLGGDYKAENGVVVSGRTGPVGNYSTTTSQALPGQSITTSPTVNFTPYRPGAGVPPIAQQGGGMSAGQPAAAAGSAPSNGLDANGDAVPVVNAEDADKLPVTGVSFSAPVAGRVSSGFGPRARPTAGATTNHMGMDYAVPNGTPVSAAADGTVLTAGPVRGFGNAVLIRHGDGSTSLYGHLSGVAVQPGQSVQQGQNIGASGSTGITTGPNLHFAIYDANNRPVNPQTVLARGSTAPTRQAQASSTPIPQTDGTTAAGPVTIQGSVSSTGGPVPGSQRYQIVDGSKVPGGKPGERYTVDTLGVEKPAPVEGGFNAAMVSQRGQQFMESDDYKSAANTVSAVNGLINTMKTVGPSAPLSWAALDTAMRAFNPSMGVRQNAIQAFMEEVGLPNEVQSEIMKVQGKGFVPPEVQHQLLTAAYAYAQSHIGILQQRHETNVKWAQAHSFGEGDLGESLPAIAPFPTSGPVPMNERVVGRAYDTPQGVLTWTGKAWAR